MARVLEQPPPRLRPRMRDVPRVLERIVLRCLAKDRTKRPADYTELVRLLRPHGSEEPSPATPGVRIVAGLIDFVALRLVAGVQTVMLLEWQERIPASALDWITWATFHLVLVVPYYVVTEAIWGRPSERP